MKVARTRGFRGRAQPIRIGQFASALDKHNIVSITDNGSSTPRVKTAAPHGLTGVETITFSGTTSYDGSHTGFTVVDATHFDLADIYVGDTLGGRWS